MRVTLKLYASLGGFLPPNAQRNAADVDALEGETIQGLLDRFHVPQGSCHLVLLNGVYQPPQARGAARLSEGDAVAVWPPVAGG